MRASCMAGVSLTTRATSANLAYNMGVIGVGVDVNVTQRVNVRADYEYQQWYSFHGQVFNSASSILSPQGITIGAAYHFQ